MNEETEVPEKVKALAEERERRRRAGEYEVADAIRERINRAGFDVVDSPSGQRLVRRQPPADRLARIAYRRSEEVPDLLSEGAVFDVSVQWVVEGWPEDVLRGIGSFRRLQGDRSVQHVVVDLTGAEPEMWQGADVVAMSPETGWGAARNAGLRRSAGEVVMMVDGSVEAVGDIFLPLIRALEDPAVGLTGPFGIVTDDLRQFRESTGHHVDAVEGYLMAMRRELVVAGIRFDERFKFYRTADIEFSFQVKARDLGVTVTPVPVRRHEHRKWANTSETERARLSKRNFYRFLDKWRGRTDLLVSRGNPGRGGGWPTDRGTGGRA